MKWFIKNFKEYGIFRGRARREEYWMFYLFAILIEFAVVIVGAMFDAMFGNFNGGDSFPFVMITLISIYGLALVIPGLAVMTRRLHDTGRSGWWYFISLVPYIGAIVLFVFLVLDSTPGTNQYGPNPKGIEGYKFTNE